MKNNRRWMTRILTKDTKQVVLPWARGTKRSRWKDNAKARACAA